MLDKLAEKIIGPISPRGIYQALGSLIAFMVVGTWLGKASIFIPDDLSTDAFGAIEGNPLAIAYRFSRFVGLPVGWISRTATYLSASDSRATVIGVVAILMGLAVTTQMTPEGRFVPISLPSLQSSTWWICMAIAIQVSHSNRLLRYDDLVLTAWLLVWWIICESRSESQKSWTRHRWLVDILQIASALCYLLIMLIPVIFDRNSNRRN